MPSPQLQAAITTYLAHRAAAAGKPRPSLDALRAGFLPGGAPHPIPDDVTVEPVTAGGVPASWILAPNVDPDRVLVFFHGGGYQIGSVASHGELAARLGRAAGMRVLFVDYRLAPEAPFPAAVDDALAAWRWLRGQGDARLAVAGDSAGGGLALALQVALRDAGEPLPAASVVMSPSVDLALTGASFTDGARDPVLTPEPVRGLAAAYLHGADPKTPLASPLYADLTGLPPMLVQVGTAEILLSDSERLAAAARAAGVDVTYVAGEGLTHVYQTIANAPEAIAATDQAGAFLRRWT